MYGTAGHGSPPHLAGSCSRRARDMKLVHVPYKGGAPAMADAIGGHIPMLIGGLPTIAPNVKAGKLRAIAVTTAKRSPILPDTPTIADPDSRASTPASGTRCWSRHTRRARECSA